MSTIEIDDVTKNYGQTVAVDRLSFAVQPGRVTGFLGPNGAGKSTTMRLALGLDRPDGGAIRIAGRPYAQLDEPMRVVGALLEARALHPGRSARNHLRYLAQTQGIGPDRVEEVLDLVGLTGVADKRVGGFSLGMGQRLGLAVALLGDPPILILDEPVNGLDVDGVRWIRTLLRTLADEGRTVLLSSHLLGEMALTADHLVVIRGGRLVADCATAAFLERSSQHSVAIESPDLARLAELIGAAGGTVELVSDKTGIVTELSAATIGQIAARHNLTLHELTTRRPSLEDAFIELTQNTTNLLESTS